MLPAFRGVAVHDRLSSYRSYQGPHQLGNAHHLRELTAPDEALGKTGTTWPKHTAELLIEIHTWRSTPRSRTPTTPAGPRRTRGSRPGSGAATAP